MFHAQRAAQDHGKFVELRTLSGLRPAGRAPPVSDTQMRIARVNAVDVLVDDFVARYGNRCGAGDEFRHPSPSLAEFRTKTARRTHPRMRSAQPRRWC